MDLLVPRVPLLSKQEYDLQLAQDIFISGLSDIDVLRTEQAHLLFKKLKTALQGFTSYEVPKTIREDLPRRKADLEEFLAKIPSISRRDILRVIALYDWASKTEEILNSIKTNQPDLKEKVLSIIKQISASKKNTSVTDIKVEKFNFRLKDEVWTSNAYIDLYSGSLSNGITISESLTATKTISFSRPLYSKNIYSSYTEDRSEFGNLQVKGYDIQESPLDAVIDISDTAVFGTVEIETNAPFEIISIERLGDTGNFETVTEQVVGRNILINGEEVISTTPESIIDSFSTSRYTLVLPYNVNRLRINVRFYGFDSYSVKLYELINSRGEIVRSYNLKESMIIDTRLAGSVYDKERQELLESTRLGQLREVNTPNPLRIIEFKNIKVNNILTTTASVTTTKFIASDLKIKNVQFYVDSYDPLQLIRFKVLYGKDSIKGISPINSNPVDPTVLNFDGALPTEVQIQIEIPLVASYRPVIHGMAVLLGEVNL